MFENLRGKKITLKKILLISLACFLAWKIFYILSGHNAIFFRSFAGYLLYSIFPLSLWRGRHIPRKWFFCLLVILSLYQLSLLINFKDMAGLLINDDYPKFYAYTLENAQSLIKYGSPFGFNHNFQGGIPAFYLRSCFLEFIPFMLIFGSQLGYQVMLVFFAVLLPVSFFFLTLEFSKNEDAARLASFLATTQIGAWHFISCGIAPALLAMPLLFFSVFFFIRYLYGRKQCFFYLLFFFSLLAYTHTGKFLTAWLIFTIIFIYKSITQKGIASNFKKVAYFGLFSFLVCLPLYYAVFNQMSFLWFGWRYPQEAPLANFWAAFFELKQSINIKNILFLSTVFLLHFYYIIEDRQKKLILRNALIISIIIFFIPALANIFTLYEWRFIQRAIARMQQAFVPYISVFNIACLAMLETNKKAKTLGIIAALFIIVNQYQPYEHCLLPVAQKASHIDSRLGDFIGPEDYVIFENCGHLSSARPGYKDTKGPYDRGHWLMPLQRHLGANFFSRTGDDPYPVNKFKHMYITNGFYNGRPLDGQQEELMALLKAWGVNKACVWSDDAIKFFDNSKYFRPLGKSQRYNCYAATYAILPEVRLSGAAKGKITNEQPFSFTVSLKNISENQSVIINKNYFKGWSAYDENGRRVPLRQCKQKICFDVSGDGRIFFKYHKNLLLNIIALLTLLFALALHLKSSYEAHRPDSRI